MKIKENDYDDWITKHEVDNPIKSVLTRIYQNEVRIKSSSSTQRFKCNEGDIDGDFTAIEIITFTNGDKSEQESLVYWAKIEDLAIGHKDMEYWKSISPIIRFDEFYDATVTESKS
jgi:hypothetical protein